MNNTTDDDKANRMTELRAHRDKLQAELALEEAKHAELNIVSDGIEDVD